MSVVTTLKQAEIFAGLTLTQLELVASISTEHFYGADELIFEAHTAGTELYVISQGVVDIQVDPAMMGREGSGTPQTIARLHPGQSFGEVALLDQGLRSARAVAAQPDTRVLVMPRDQLLLLCNSYPQMGYRVMRNLAADLATKIRHTDLKVREYLTWMPDRE